MYTTIERATFYTGTASTISDANKEMNRDEPIFLIEKVLRRREDIISLYKDSLIDWKCYFCKAQKKKFRSFTCKRNILYHLNSYHREKIIQFNQLQNFSGIIKKKICDYCGKYVMEERKKKHLKSCTGYIVKKYNYLDLKIIELVNYVYRKSINFNKVYEQKKDLPNFDLLAFFMDYYEQKEKKECDQILNMNMFERRNRIIYVEKNDEKWNKHCWFMSRLFLYNKKLFFSLYNGEIKRFKDNLSSLINEKKDFYSGLKEEIEDYIKNKCNLLNNNEEFIKMGDLENIELYDGYIDFKNKITNFLEKNEQENIDRCPLCKQFVDKIYEHFFIYCEVLPIKIVELNFKNNDDNNDENDSFLFFIYDTIENSVVGHNLIKKRFSFQKDKIKKYIKNIKKTDFNSIQKIKIHLKNIFTLRSECNDLNNLTDFNNNNEIKSRKKKNNWKIFFNELMEEIEEGDLGLEESIINNEALPEIEELKKGLFGESKVFINKENGDQDITMHENNPNKDSKKSNDKEKTENKQFNSNIFGLLFNNNNKNKSNESKTFLGKKREHKKHTKKEIDLNIQLKNWVDGMYFFDINEKLKINSNEVYIENINFFKEIDKFEIPFSFKYQIYKAYKNLYEAEENNYSICKNVKIFSKCIESIYLNKIEKQKFLKEKEKRRKGLENYIQIMKSIKENKYYCYKPTEEYNNYAISFIKESKKFLKNQERNLISNHCIKYDNNALYAEGIYKKIFIKSHIDPKNDNEKNIKNAYSCLWNDYINSEIKFEKAQHELEELYGKDTLGKKIYLKRNYHIINQIEIQTEEYMSRLKFKENNQKAKEIAKNFEERNKEEEEKEYLKKEDKELKELNNKWEKFEEEFEERKKREFEEVKMRFMEDVQKRKKLDNESLNKIRKLIGY